MQWRGQNTVLPKAESFPLRVSTTLCCPFIHQWTFGLLSHPSSCESCCCEHSVGTSLLNRDFNYVAHTPRSGTSGDCGNRSHFLRTNHNFPSDCAIFISADGANLCSSVVSSTCFPASSCGVLCCEVAHQRLVPCTPLVISDVALLLTCVWAVCSCSLEKHLFEAFLRSDSVAELGEFSL